MFNQIVGALYQGLITTSNVRDDLQPGAGVAAVTVTCGKQAFGSYAQICAASVITNPSWITHLVPTNPVVAGAGTNTEYDFGIGVGAAASEVDVAGVSLTINEVTNVGFFTLPQIPLAFPRMVAGSPRLAVRGAGSDAGATHAIDVKLRLMRGVLG